MPKENKTVKQQLEDIGIDLLENEDVPTFQDSYCPNCNEPTAVRTAVRPFELTCRFCQMTFTEH